MNHSTDPVRDAVRLGMLTPSSNTVVEPTTNAILRSVEHATAHFSRFKVTEISMSSAGLAQFERETFLQAAELLSHAFMHVIAWNGTSAAWRGFDEDVSFCQDVSERFGVPATASMLALNLVLNHINVRRLGIVTPYSDAVQSKILQNYRDAGFDTVAERHSGIEVNFEFSKIPAQEVGRMAHEVAQSKPEAMIIICTNLNCAHIVPQLEAELGIPIFDSTSVVVWHALRLAGVNTSCIRDWGSLFTQDEYQSIA